MKCVFSSFDFADCRETPCIYIYIYIPGIVPFLLLLGLNVAIYSKIRQMQKENFDMTRSSALQRQKEIKLSQISIAIAAGR